VSPAEIAKPAGSKPYGPPDDLLQIILKIDQPHKSDFVGLA